MFFSRLIKVSLQLQVGKQTLIISGRLDRQPDSRRKIRVVDGEPTIVSVVDFQEVRQLRLEAPYNQLRVSHFSLWI